METRAGADSTPDDRAPVDHLRALVVGLRARGRRRLIPTGFSVALVDGVEGRINATGDLLAPLLDGPDPDADQAPLPHPLRVDLVARGLAGLEPVAGPTGLRGQQNLRGHQKLQNSRNPPNTRNPPDTFGAAFLLRGGDIELRSDDFAWWRAFQAGCGVAAITTVEMYAVTRYGWVDVRRDHAVRVPRLRRVATRPNQVSPQGTRFLEDSSG